MEGISQDLCLLCGLNLPRNPISEGNHRFCCAGCRAVHTILAGKGELDGFATHPLYQQAVASGLISNSTFVAEEKEAEGPTEKVRLQIGEMWCSSCAEVIRLVLLQQRGVIRCQIDYATDLAAIEYDPLAISKEELFRQIKALGYEPSSLEQMGTRVARGLYLRLGVALFAALNLMMFAYPVYANRWSDGEGYTTLFNWLSLMMAVPVVFYSGWPIFRKAAVALRVGVVGMELLVAMGVGTAFGYSLYQLILGGSHVYFDSMAVIVAFVLLGRIIETKAKFSAKETLIHLTRSIPKRARRLTSEGETESVSLKELAVGDHLVVAAGERIVLDGSVVGGEGFCDESLVTGEARLVSKGVSDRVVGGSLLKRGSLVIEVLAKPEESTLQQIIHLVEGDLAHKSPYMRLADRVVQWFVPSILLLALVVGMIQGPLIAVSVLLISCPCALGIAVPLAESLLLQQMARRGVFVRNRGVLPLLGRETVFAFDKTGTLTEGKFRVLWGLEGLSGEERVLLKGLASRSTHPVSAALAESISEVGFLFETVEEVSGRGLVGNETVLLGSAEHLRERGISIEASESDETLVYFARGKEVVATIALGDELREDCSVIEDLPGRKIILSGDSEGVVRRIASRCRVDESMAGVTPLEKQEWVRKEKERGEIVCFVGDGINDAPALTAASIGVSMGSATDMATQVSDLILTSNRLSLLSEVGALAKRGRRIAAQNLFWAFFYNVVGVGLAAFGFLSPIIAAAAMVASSLFVVFNALRLR